MIGAIIGDIVGSRFEFNNYRHTDFEIFHPDCSFTDDTVCTCAVADWVIQGGMNIPTPGPKFALLLQSWCLRYPNPKGGYGGRFRDWIDNPVPYDSFGNGAAMRVSPVGDYFDFDKDLRSGVEMVTAVSHNHPEGLKGAQATAMAIWLAKCGSDKIEICNIASKEFGYNLNFTCDSIRKTNQFDETCQVTVPQALVCFQQSTDFESAIRLAVSIGGDSDTIAAIAGSIAEAYYGVPDWMKDEAMHRLPLEMQKLTIDFYQMLNHKL